MLDLAVSPVSLALLDPRSGSTPTPTPAPTPPENSAPPTVAGTPVVGQVLTASVGSWSGSPTGYAWQWYADAVALAGATAAGFELTENEVGAEITVGVVATNSAGDSAEAISAPIGPVEAAEEPVTSEIAYAAIAGGFTLLHDDGSYGGYASIPTDGTQSRSAIWCGMITGTDASIKLKSRFPGVQAPIILVTVDGGAQVEVDDGPEADFYSLFSGLSDDPHFVTWQPKATSNYPYMPTAEGTVMKVTGVLPAVGLAGEWAVAADEVGKHVMPGGRTASLLEDFGSWLGASRSPLLRPAWDGDGASGTGRAGHQPAIRFRTAATELWVVSQSRRFALMIGEDYTIYDTGKAGNAIGADKVRALRLTGLPEGDKTISLIAGADISPPGQWLAVGVPSGQSFGTVPSPKRAHLFGDSITQGAGVGGYGQELMSLSTDVHRAFGALGYAVGNFAIAGTSWGDLESTINGWLALLPAATGSDVAYVAQGQNATPAEAEMDSVLDALVAKGYGKIVVRGVLPVIGNGHIAKNAIISAAVAGYGNPDVVYIDPNGWTELAAGGADFRPDGIHFAPLGYDAILARMNVALPSALA